MTIDEERAADNEQAPYKQVIAGTIQMTGAMADQLIVAYIDNADIKLVATELGMSEKDCTAYTQKFEEQIRHQVRSLNRGV